MLVMSVCVFECDIFLVCCLLEKCTEIGQWPPVIFGSTLQLSQPWRERIHNIASYAHDNCAHTVT